MLLNLVDKALSRENPAILSGVIQDSVPPQIMALAIPYLMKLAASPIMNVGYGKYLWSVEVVSPME